MDRKKVEERRRLERGLKDVNWRRQRDDDVEEVNNKMLLFTLLHGKCCGIYV